MNAQDVRRLIAYASELWPQTFELPATPEKLQLRVEVWLEFLSDLPAEAVRVALAQAAEEPFPPAPGALRQAALRLLSADLPPDADQAVAEIMTAIHRVGYYGSPEWSHPALAQTVEAFGGWQAVCTSEHPESQRAHLLKLYATASRRHNSEQSMAPAFAELLGSVLPELESGQRIRALEEGSALPSPSSADRDDDLGLRSIQQVHETIEAVRRASRDPGETDDGAGIDRVARSLRSRSGSSPDDRGE